MLHRRRLLLEVEPCALGRRELRAALVVARAALGEELVVGGGMGMDELGPLGAQREQHRVFLLQQLVRPEEQRVHVDGIRRRQLAAAAAAAEGVEFSAERAPSLAPRCAPASRAAESPVAEKGDEVATVDEHIAAQRCHPRIHRRLR